MLSEYDYNRYDRQIMIENFGEDGQDKLRKGKVFIAGVGGLGSTASIWLAAAGVGTIRIVDDGRIEAGNLNRQIVYSEEDIGRKKIYACAESIKAFNPAVNVESFDETMRSDNIYEFIKDSDLIIDAMNNLDDRLLLNEAALKLDIPLLHGAVNGFDGRVTTIIKEKTACFECIYNLKDFNYEEKYPVIGVATAVIGSIQAAEAIKYITGMGELLINRMLIYKGLKTKFSELPLKRDSFCSACGEI